MKTNPILSHLIAETEIHRFLELHEIKADGTVAYAVTPEGLLIAVIKQSASDKPITKHIGRLSIVVDGHTLNVDPNKTLSIIGGENVYVSANTDIDGNVSVTISAPSNSSILNDEMEFSMGSFDDPKSGQFGPENSNILWDKFQTDPFNL